MSHTTMTAALTQFAQQERLEGLTAPTLQGLLDKAPGYTVERAHAFLSFQSRLNTELLQHPVITRNPYTAWFEQGEQTLEQIKAFVVQFSVFSNLFLFAQLKKMINADSLDGMHASKEILANEIGVIFNRKDQPVVRQDANLAPDFVSPEGSVEGGSFRFKAAHFEWLLHIGEFLGLAFNDLGKRRHGISSTLFFCDEMWRLYGSEDYAESQAASYAVENWAAAGFWDQLVRGFELFNEKHNMRIPVGFFSWHSRLEAQHAQHTQEELEEYFFQHNLDTDQFIRIGNEMLDGVNALWLGLDEQRKRLTSH